MIRRSLSKRIKFRHFLFLIFLFFFIPSFVVTARAEDDAQGKLNENILEQLEQLDLGELEEYLQSISGGNISAKERLLEYINGGGFSQETFLKEMSDVFLGGVKRMLPSFASIAAIAMLCALINTLQSRFLGQSTAKIIFFVAYLGALIPLFGVLAECIFTARDTVVQLKTQMEVVFPLMLTLMAASGGSVSVSIFRPAVVFLSNGLVTIISNVVFPLTVVIIVFSMAGKVFGELKTDKFAAFFKSINKWIMGVGVSVFGLFFTVQGITAATYDGILRRTAKYAIGTGVPIVGGLLSGGFDLAVAGSILIKNALGNFSLFLLVGVLFEPILLLISVNLLLRLTSAVTQPFGDSKISSFLDETAQNLNYCTAGLLFTAFLYFVAILLLVSASEMFL